MVSLFYIRDMVVLKTGVWSRSNVWCQCEKNTWPHVISNRLRVYSERCSGEILAKILQTLSDDKNEYDFFKQDGAPAHQSNHSIIMLRIILRDWILPVISDLHVQPSWGHVTISCGRLWKTIRTRTIHQHKHTHKQTHTTILNPAPATDSF
jgi:hypothetical protein